MGKKDFKTEQVKTTFDVNDDSDEVMQATSKAIQKAPGQQFVDLGLVKVKDLMINPDNQNEFNDGKFVRMKASISNNGFMKKKILVRAMPPGSDAKFMVIDGNHHLKAASELGYKRVPCLLYVANWTGVSS